jgi:NADH dehydrogenase FAD-containing subunit
MIYPETGRARTGSSFAGWPAIYLISVNGGEMGRKLVLIGGGHAHMVTLAGIGALVARGHRVTVVGPSEHHYYSGMGPGMLGGTYAPSEIRFATRKVVEIQGGTFVLDYVSRIDPLAKRLHLASGTAIDYDILSCNAGSHVPQLGVTADRGNIFSVKPIEKLQAAKERFLELAGRGRIEIGIVGGGPSSAEIAGNILQLAKSRALPLPEVRIFSGSSFMKRFPGPVRRLVRRDLERRGIRIVEGSYVREVQTGRIGLEDGQSFQPDLIFMAVGVKPSPIFADSGLPVGPDGGLLVNRFLQSPVHPEIFGGGDCIYFQEVPLAKVGVYAVRENPVLHHNLLAGLEGGELQPFSPGGDYLLIFNLGEGRGVLHKRWLTFGGRLAFRIKDYIDRRFMRRFQALEV